MAKRKAIPKKVRFEVFKRDKFTCQYCGAKAPDVVLQIDHIKPVAHDGENDIMNLVTACEDCNQGKGERELSDDSAIKAQRNQLERLAEQREQLELMYQWQLELVKKPNDQAQIVCDLISDMTGYEIYESGKKDIKKWINQFGLETVLDSARISFTQYEFDTDYRWQRAFRKIGGIAFYKTHKTCSQCVHDVGFDPDTRLVECEYDHGGSYWCKNDFAESCDYYKPKFKDGAK